MPTQSRYRILTWIVALLAAAAGPVVVAAEIATDGAVEEATVLDEVLVHGKRLEQRIVEAEDEFYRLYNQVNEDDKYQVNCAYVKVDPDYAASRITRRICLPGFVADAVAEWTAFQMLCLPPLQEGFDEFDCLDKNNDHRLYPRELAARPDLQQMALGGQGYITRSDWDAFSQSTLASQGATALYMPPRPTLVLMEGTKAWYEHMLQVIRSDPRLSEMAGRLDDLHEEYMTLQAQEAQMRKQYYAEKVRRSGGYNRGPCGR